MARIGGYETVRRMHQAGMVTTWAARPEDADPDEPAQFILKVFENVVTEVTQVGFAAEDEGFRHAVSTQHELCEGGARHWAPIHKAGRIIGGSYYVSDIYHLTLDDLIRDPSIEIDGRAVHRIVSAAVAALVELRDICGRAHGSLRASNVLIHSQGDIGRARVVLTDPLAPDKFAPTTGEADDLRTLGHLLYEVVVRRPFRSTSPWPIPPSTAWNRLGRTADAWRELCSRLLDHDPKPGQLTLEAIGEELDRIARRRPLALPAAILGGAAALALLVYAAVWLARNVHIFGPTGAEREFAHQWLQVCTDHHYWFARFFRDLEYDRARRRRWERDDDLMPVLQRLDEARKSRDGVWVPQEGLEAAEAPPSILRPSEQDRADIAGARRSFQLFDGVRAALLKQLRDLSGAWKGRGWHRPAWHLDDLAEQAAAGKRAAAERAVAAFRQRLEPRRREQLLEVERSGHRAMGQILSLEGRQLPQIEALWRELEPYRADVGPQTRSEPGPATARDVVSLLDKLQRIRDLQHVQGPAIPAGKTAQWATRLQSIAHTVECLRRYADAVADQKLVAVSAGLQRQHALLAKERDRLLAASRRPLAAGPRPDPAELDKKLGDLPTQVAAALRTRHLDDPKRWWSHVRARAVPASKRLNTQWSARRDQLLADAPLAKLQGDLGTFLRAAASVDKAWQSIREEARRELADLERLEQQLTRAADAVQAAAAGDSITANVRTHTDAEIQRLAGRDAQERRDRLEAALTLLADLQRWMRNDQVDRRAFLGERTVRPRAGNRVDKATLDAWLTEIPRYVKLPAADDPRRGGRPWKATLDAIARQLAALRASADPRRRKQVPDFDARRRTLEAEIQKLDKAPWIARNRATVVARARTLDQAARDLLEDTRTPPPLTEAERRLLAETRRLQAAATALVNSIEAHAHGDKILSAFVAQARAQLAAAEKPSQKRRDALKSLGDRAAQLERWASDPTVDRKLFLSQRTVRLGPAGRVTPAILADWLEQVPGYVKLPPADDPRRDAKAWKNRSAEIARRIRALTDSAEPKDQQQGARFGQALAKLDGDIDRMWRFAWIKKNQAAIAQAASTLGKAAQDLLGEVEKPTDTEQRIVRLRTQIQRTSAELTRRADALEAKAKGDRILVGFLALARAKLKADPGPDLQDHLDTLNDFQGLAQRVERALDDATIDRQAFLEQRTVRPNPDGTVSPSVVRKWLAEVPDFAKLPPPADPRGKRADWRARSEAIAQQLGKLANSPDPRRKKKAGELTQAHERLRTEIDRLWGLAWVKRNQDAITQDAARLRGASAELLAEARKPPPLTKQELALLAEVQRLQDELPPRLNAVQAKAGRDPILARFARDARGALAMPRGRDLQTRRDALRELADFAAKLQPWVQDARVDRELFLNQREAAPNPDGSISPAILRAWLSEVPGYVKLPPADDPRGAAQPWRDRLARIERRVHTVAQSTHPNDKQRGGRHRQALDALRRDVDQMLQLPWIKKNERPITLAAARLQKSAAGLLEQAERPTEAEARIVRLKGDIQRLEAELTTRAAALGRNAAGDAIVAAFARYVAQRLGAAAGPDLQQRADELSRLDAAAAEVLRQLANADIDREAFRQQRKARPNRDGSVSLAIVRAWLDEVPDYAKLAPADDPRRDPKAWNDRCAEIARRIHVLEGSLNPQDKRRGAQLDKKLDALKDQLDAMWQLEGLEKNRQTLIATATRLTKSADALLDEVGEPKPTPDPRPAERVWQGKLAAARSSLATLATLSKWHRGLPVPDLKTALDTLAGDVARMQHLTWPDDRARIWPLVEASKRAADVLPRDLGAAVERASGAPAADLIRLRALQDPTTSAVLNREWLRRRDASAPPLHPPVNGGTEGGQPQTPTAASVRAAAKAYATHWRHVQALRTFLIGLDDQGQLPRGPAPARAREERREEALKNALALVAWQPDGTPRQSLDEFQRAPAWQDLCRAYRKGALEDEGLVADFRKIQTLLDWGYLLDDKPVAASHTARQLHARWKGKAAAGKLPPSLRPVAARVDELLRLDGLAPAELIAWVKRADAEAPPLLRAAAWLRLATARGWPATLADLKLERRLQADVERLVRQPRDPARAAWLRRHLAREAPRRWEAAFNAIAGRVASDSLDAPDLAAALELRGEFGASLDGLAAATRLRIRLHGLRQAIGALPDAAPRAAAAAAVAQFEKGLQALPSEVLRQPRVRGLLAGLRKRVGGGGAAATAAGGPATSGAVPGWRATTAPGGKAIVYSWAAKGHRLTFVRVESAGPAPVYLCTSEVAFGLFADVVAASGKWADLSGQFQDGNPALMQWKGPRVWRRTREGGPLRQSKNWLARSPAIRDAPYAPGLRVDWPSKEHPMQCIGPRAAQAFARLLGCRLPTSGEWRAAHQAAWKAGGQPNLRDATWRRQKEHRVGQRDTRAEALRRQGLPARVSVNWPDDGIFLPKHFRVARGAEAEPATGGSDGLLWFAEAGAARGSDTSFRHLVGNVAEYVLDPDSGFKVVGASALSPGGLWDGKSRPYHVAWPVDPDGARFGYSDVGLRLAHSVGGAAFDIAGLRDYLKGARYLP